VDPKKIDGMQISRAQMKKNMAKFNKAEKEMTVMQRASFLLAMDESLSDGGSPIISKCQVRGGSMSDQSWINV
jgi:hypothetical protein